MRAGMAWLGVGLLLLGGAGAAAAEGLKPATRISQDLAELISPRAAGLSVWADEGVIESPMIPIPDVVTIDAVASGDPAALEAELIALGAQDTAIAGRMVSARIPLAAIPFLDSVTSLQFARAARAVTHVGSVTSQGDKALRAEIARGLYGVDGTGVLVGVLSDSYNCLGGATLDMATGDLPPTVMVVQESSCGQNSKSDEGRAMLQIVHDVAPGASLAFATGFGGQAGFANNILALRDQGAQVIVDDIGYFAAPMFQDGVIAQAVDNVKATGVAYFSAAGNQARQAYEHAFVPGQVFTPGQFGDAFKGGTAHDFGGTALQRIAVPPRTSFTLALQWDSPFFSVSGPEGTPNDLDIYILQNNVAVLAATTNNLSKDPVEILDVVCNGRVTCVGSIMIVNHAGPDPGRFKFVFYGASRLLTLTPATNSGTIVGHANALGAITVGASNHKTPTTLEPYSSGGTTPILFDTLGIRLETPDPRQFKPEIVAPDGANTTFFSAGNDPDFDGFPNFSGTSAAAPHAAGVAALMVQAIPTLPPETLRNTLENTALNMGPVGFDVNTGFGLIRADAALGALHTLTITADPSGTPNPVRPGDVVNLSVDAVDSFVGHVLTFAWTSACTGILNGTFDDATLKTPTWTAAANATGATQTCVLKVVVKDGHGTTKTASFNEMVLSVPKVTTLTPAAATVGTTITIGGMGLTGSSLVTFAGGATAVPTAVTATSLQVVVPAGALTGILSVTNPAGSGNSATAFKALPKITSFTPPAVVGGSLTTVTVTGTNLMVGTTTPTVKVGTFVVPIGSILSSSLTEVTFPVPPGATTGKIGITTVDGTATSATTLVVILPPKPTGFVPAMAAVGTDIVINGTNLAGATDVTFAGSVTATPTAVTATSLHVVVPAGAVTGPVSVVNPAGTATTKASFKVLPKITSFTPPEVVGASATVVTVNGFNLKVGATAPTVKVGTITIPAGQVTSTPTQITFTLPVGAVTGKISITTVDGTATSATNLVVILPPKPMTFLPAMAVVGMDIVISGTTLAGTTSVTFTGPVSVTATAVTATSLHAVVPAGALSGPVSVANPADTGATTASFKVLPKITGFEPASAVGGSATVITVNGFNLKVGATTPAVKIGAFVVPPASISSSGTQLLFPVPLGAVTGKIMVTTVDGAAASATALTVVQPPRATTFAPASAMVGTDIAVTGTNMALATLVTFTGGATAVPTAVSATSLHVVIPVGALTGPVSVTNPIGTAPSVASLKVLPKITGFSPSSAVAGSATVVTVDGLNLKVGATTPTVKVGTFVVPPGSIQSSSATQLAFTVPLGAVTGKISIMTADGTATSPANLDVIQPPKVTAFVPLAAAVGTDIVINGANLTGATLITFTGPSTPTATATLVTPTSLHAVVPAGAVTGPVSVTNPIATGISSAGFTVLPKIISFTPASGAVGAEVIVTGTSLRLLSDPVVKVGTVTAMVTSSTGTELRFTIPAGAVTAKIAITTADGTATSATSLTVTP
jgi:hypothetical protein